MLRIVMITLLFALSGPLWANLAPPPVQYDVLSPNGEWVLKANRHEAEQRICRAGSEKTEWSFSIEAPGEQTFYLSKDGATVAIVGPWWFKTDAKPTAAVRLMRRSGIFAEFEHDTLCPKMVKSKNNPGWLWRSEQSNNTLIIKAQDGTLSRISLETGKLLGQETFEIPADSGYCTTSPALSYAFGALFALLGALSLLVLIRRRAA
ncbi:MAG: hypothetical protein KBG84_00070 [Planctomycetes bacterium]|nr:hypothetical protein [Planctomycetota bacterium]